jgi:hypothetical protein
MIKISKLIQLCSPEHKTVKNLSIGGVGYTVPWSLTPVIIPNSDLIRWFICSECKLREVPGGTSCLKISRTILGYVAEIPKDIWTGDHYKMVTNNPEKLNKLSEKYCFQNKIRETVPSYSPQTEITLFVV